MILPEVLLLATEVDVPTEDGSGMVHSLAIICVGYMFDVRAPGSAAATTFEIRHTYRVYHTTGGGGSQRMLEKPKSGEAVRYKHLVEAVNGVQSLAEKVKGGKASAEVTD